MINIEALRSDRQSGEDKLLAFVVNINRVNGTVDVRSFGAVQRVLTEVPIVGAESIFNIGIGDKVAISRFSGEWLCLGKIQTPRRESMTTAEILATRRLTTYGSTYVHGDVIFGAEGHRLTRVEDDLYWWDGSSMTKLN